VSHVPAERCLSVLELLAEGAKSLTLGEIAERLEEPKSGIHRLLSTLVSQGWAEQDLQTGLYSLTMRLTLIGQRFYADTGIPDMCQPLLDQLAAETQDYVRMAIAAGDSLNWLGDAQGARGGLMYYPPQVSGKVPLHATASGKSWLATMDKKTALAIVKAQGFNAETNLGPQVTTNAHDLMQLIQETAKLGYGTAINEAEPGVSAVAAAVRIHADGPGVGTVSVAGPSVRMTPERIHELGPVVRAYAERLGEIWPLRHKPGIARIRA
jgi:IclR family acetate operon transcriptional repressor